MRRRAVVLSRIGMIHAGRFPLGRENRVVPRAFPLRRPLNHQRAPPSVIGGRRDPRTARGSRLNVPPARCSRCSHRRSSDRGAGGKCPHPSRSRTPSTSDCVRRTLRSEQWYDTDRTRRTRLLFRDPSSRPHPDACKRLLLCTRHSASIVGSDGATRSRKISLHEADTLDLERFTPNALLRSAQGASRLPQHDEFRTVHRERPKRARTIGCTYITFPVRHGRQTVREAFFSTVCGPLSAASSKRVPSVGTWGQ